MKLNNVDIKKYNAKQMKVEFQPASRTTSAEWNSSQKLPKEFETEVGFITLKVTVYFKGTNRTQVKRNIDEFLSLITGGTEIELDKYKGTYKGYLKSDPTVTATKEINKKIVTLEFKGYMYDDEIVLTVKGTKAETVNLVGAREAACIIEVFAKEKVSNVVISGFGNDEIIIESMTKGETIIIDGVNGKVTSQDENAFNRVDIWEFPYIKRKVLVSVENATVDLTIRYNPLWS